MSICKVAPQPSRRRLHKFSTFSFVSLTAIIFWFSHAAFAVQNKEAPAKSCTFSDAAFDPSTDVHAIDAFSDAIGRLLKAENFADLDCLADAARTGKTRFAGGKWKLTFIYAGLGEPRDGHPTQEDWQSHLQLIEHWMKQNPQSITARVALAESYTGYAWDARGSGYSDSVSESGWKLFGERLDKAKSILDEAASLPTKCPEWYAAMLDVGRGQSWSLEEQTALFQKAVTFDPTYQGFYRNHVISLLPKWSGNEGDGAAFAASQADHVGGDAGDILYFQIAQKIICACEDNEFSHFSWPRVQHGFTALEKKYGSALENINTYALMAVKSGDWATADAAFRRIGNQWSKDVWMTEDWFKQNQSTATQMGPVILRAHQLRDEAAANAKTPEGMAYLKLAEKSWSGIEKSCFETAGDFSRFQIVLELEKDGNLQDARTDNGSTIAQCLLRTLYPSFVKKDKLFPPPPHSPYAVAFDIDPATFKASR